MQGVLDGLPIGLVLFTGVFAPLTGWFAARRSRHPVIWFALGAVIGPLAIGILAIAPPGRCPACDERTRGWARWCEHCGTRLRGSPTTDARIARSVTTPALDPVHGSGSISAADALTNRAATPLPAPRRETRTRGTVGVMEAPRSTATARPIAVPRPPTFVTANPLSEPTTGEVLATGVYLSGNGGLEIGATYGLARAGDRLRVFGPVDAGQLTVRQEGPLADFEVTAMDDRVIISGRGGRSSLAIVFRLIGGMRAIDLEDALGPPAIGHEGSS